MRLYSGFRLLLLLLLFGPGCALLTPVNTETNRYMLDQMPARVPVAIQHPLDLLVMAPETGAVYNTSKMAYSLQAHEIAWYSKNQWGATPSQMLHPLIIATLQNTHFFRTVITPPGSNQNTWILRTHILTLLQDFTNTPARLRMSVRVTLVNALNNHAIATATFSHAIPMQQPTPRAGVAAANQATVLILRDISKFVVKSRIIHDPKQGTSSRV